MEGIAEKLDGYSRRLRDNLVIGNPYTLPDLAFFLDVDPASMNRKGVVPRVDAQLLFLHLQKDELSVPQYEDHMNGSILFWSGQNRIKSVEKALLDGSKDTFVFIQTARGTPFVYYGRAYPLRMQIHWEPDVPSHIVFELYEYAALHGGIPKVATPQQTPVAVTQTIQTTEKERVQKVRTAQTAYRNQALALWNNKCAITAVDDVSWLIASHIKPWHESSDQEKIDPYNSLVLTPNYDKLFDRGVISFSPKNGKIILPEMQSREMWNNLARMHIDDTVTLSALPDQTAKYLEYHNNYVYSFEPRDGISNADYVESLVAKHIC